MTSRNKELPSVRKNMADSNSIVVNNQFYYFRRPTKSAVYNCYTSVRIYVESTEEAVKVIQKWMRETYEKK